MSSQTERKAGVKQTEEFKKNKLKVKIKLHED